MEKFKAVCAFTSIARKTVKRLTYTLISDHFMLIPEITENESFVGSMNWAASQISYSTPPLNHRHIYYKFDFQYHIIIAGSVVVAHPHFLLYVLPLLLVP